MLRDEVDRKQLKGEVQIIRTGCFGFCEKGPIVKVLPDNTFYTQVKPSDAREIIDEHVIKGRRVERLLYLDPGTEEHVLDSKHMALRNSCASRCATVAPLTRRTSRSR